MKCTNGLLGDEIMSEIHNGTRQGIQEGSSTGTAYTSSSDVMDDVERILINGVVTIGVKLLSSLLHP